MSSNNPLKAGSYAVWYWKSRYDYSPGCARGCLVKILDRGPLDRGVVLCCPYHTVSGNSIGNSIFVADLGDLVPV